MAYASPREMFRPVESLIIRRSSSALCFERMAIAQPFQLGNRNSCNRVINYDLVVGIDNTIAVIVVVARWRVPIPAILMTIAPSVV